jgi:hypothetical protein
MYDGKKYRGKNSGKEKMSNAMTAHLRYLFVMNPNRFPG